MSNKRAPGFTFYVKDWLGDDEVMAMDLDAQGLHLRYMCIAWQQQPPCTLPNDDSKLRKWAGNPDEENWLRIKGQVFSAWEEDNGRWVQNGLLRQFKKQSENSEKRKKAAEKRWEGHSKSNANVSANAMHKECLASSSSYSYEDEEDARPGGAASSRLPDWRIRLNKQFVETAMARRQSGKPWKNAPEVRTWVIKTYHEITKDFISEDEIEEIVKYLKEET